MRPSVILMGSKPGSVVALRLLVKRGWNIRCVVTTPEVKHDWIEGPTLAEEAHKFGIKVCTQDDLPCTDKVDFVISYMYRKLVKSDVIKLAKRGALNFHAGPLPRFGGWAFYNLAILEEVKEYGCTCHYMDDGFDTGPILQVNLFPINASEHTAISLERDAQREMIRMFVDILTLAESGAALPKLEQVKEHMRYLTKAEFMKLKEIPQNADETTIDRYARAFWYPPYECAYIKLGQAKAEVIPNIAKEHYAKLTHFDSLNDLDNIAKEHTLNNQKSELH